MSSACSRFRPSTRRPPGDHALELVAQRFAVLSQPLRLKLIRALLGGEKHVNALVGETGATQTNVSRQLHALAQAQILARRKEGLQVYYRLADPSVLTLCETACGSLEKQLWKQADAFH